MISNAIKTRKNTEKNASCEQPAKHTTDSLSPTTATDRISPVAWLKCSRSECERHTLDETLPWAYQDAIKHYVELGIHVSKDRSSRRVRRCKWYLTPLRIISANLAKATCEIPGVDHSHLTSLPGKNWGGFGAVFWVVYVLAITQKINSINGVQPTFPPLTAIVWSYLGVPISRFSSVFFAQKNDP